MNKLIKGLTGKNIVVVGLGIENLALVDYLGKQKLKASLTIFEGRPAVALGERVARLKRFKHIQWRFNEARPERLTDYDIIIKSSGAFFSPAERQRTSKAGTRIVSALQLFLDICPSKNIIGVTGTKGKGTTSSLIAAILKKAGRRVFLGGNIGIAVFDFLARVRKSDWIVLELSSFQLEDMQPNPRIAVFTNLSPEHLAPADASNPNYHVSYKAYWGAKFNLARYQSAQGIIIADSSLAVRLHKEKLAGRLILSEASALKSRLPGEHNQRNIALAAAAARYAGIKEAMIAKAVASFKGLPYRLEKIASRNGIDYYNDSFSTTPASTITALKAFDRPIILIAGGADKGSDFSTLARAIKAHSKSVILFKGAALEKLKTALARINYPRTAIKIAGSMKEAITQARHETKAGDIILLSPACASFGIFKNYKDRGEQFNRFASR